MNNKTNYQYLLSDLSSLKGVGTKTKNLLKKKNINNLFDLLWKLPKSFTDRSLSSKIKDLKIGETQTVTIIPQKYNLFHQFHHYMKLCLVISLFLGSYTFVEL